MSEKLSFTAGGQEYEMTPENTILVRYRKIGEEGVRAAMYDHVLHITEPPIYAWLDPHGEEYADQVEEIMRQEGFTAMLNLPAVDEHIVNEYDRQIIAPQTKDLDGGVPEEWK